MKDIVDRIYAWIEGGDVDDAHKTLRDAQREIISLRAKLECGSAEDVSRWRDAMLEWESGAVDMRDQFAAAALTGLIANGDYGLDAAPPLAYRIADAMLRERASQSSVGVSATGAESGSTPDAQGSAQSKSCPCQPFDSAPTTDQERFNAAVMNWISEATSLLHDSFRSDGGRRIMSDACQQCWTAYGKDTTDLDAAPAATAMHSRDCSGGPSGAGDTPVTEPMLRAAPGRGSVTPHPYGKCDEKRTDSNTTGEPVAWAVVSDSTQEIDCEFVYPDAATAGDVALGSNGGVVPLYRSPTLTDAEREALEAAAEDCRYHQDPGGRSAFIEATLRGLLERTQTVEK